MGILDLLKSISTKLESKVEETKVEETKVEETKDEPIVEPKRLSNPNIYLHTLAARRYLNISGSKISTVTTIIVYYGKSIDLRFPPKYRTEKIIQDFLFILEDYPIIADYMPHSKLASLLIDIYEKKINPDDTNALIDRINKDIMDYNKKSAKSKLRTSLAIGLVTLGIGTAVSQAIKPITDRALAPKYKPIIEKDIIEKDIVESKNNTFLIPIIVLSFIGVVSYLLISKE